MGATKKAVILAGGLGVRLKPFTDVIPKPLLPLGEKSLLEIQIEHLKQNGIGEIILALGHKSEYISSFLGDGKRYGINLRYSVEDQPLGTCGPLSLLREELTDPFLLMNGDILTTANLGEILQFATDDPSTPLHVVTKIVTAPFRFGKIHTDGRYILDVEEKPDLDMEILAGIYALKPDIFEFIPDGEYFGIDELIKCLLRNDMKVGRYLLKDYWVDIGVVEDYDEARKIYEEHFR
ncbi:NTP transferase domain-containing protein [bacterium]|nr:NTP transferase domain-containing protein [bacterium]